MKNGKAHPHSLIFLDVDGVLNSNAYLSAHLDANDETALDPHAIKLLDRLTALAHASIVITSTWRIDMSIKELRSMLARRGLRRASAIIGKTPVIKKTAARFPLPADRGAEIAAYLTTAASRGWKDVPYVILDDDDDMGALRPRLVQTDPRYGLTPGVMERALSTLARQRL